MINKAFSLQFVVPLNQAMTKASVVASGLWQSSVSEVQRNSRSAWS
jgi:hypothetical protein